MNLKTQCFGIGFTYIAVACCAILYSSVKLHNPGHFVQLTEVKTHGSHEPLPYEPLDNNVTDNVTIQDTRNIIDDAETVADELEKMTAKMIKDVGINAVEMMVGGFATFIVSILLVYGIRSSKTSFILPWLVETVIQNCATFLIFLVDIATPGAISVGSAFAMVLYFAISIYFIMCVFSLYKILKIQKSSVIRFLDHEFEANEVGFYRPLDNQQSPRPGHVKPWVEKSVPMSAEEDVDKEHVLYARM